MVKELERASIPAVIICSRVSIGLPVGANRVVPGLGIPHHPLGGPGAGPGEERRKRKAPLERGVNQIERFTSNICGSGILSLIAPEGHSWTQQLQWKQTSGYVTRGVSPASEPK